MPATVRIRSTKKLTVILLCVVATLIALSIVVQTVRHTLGYDFQMGLLPLFYVDGEANLPTWYSSFALLLSAVLLGIIAISKFQQADRFRRHWCALSGLFLLLSIDEVSMLHEYPIEPLRNALDAGGAFHYTWVIPGMMFVAAVGIYFLKFLFHLPARTRNLLIAAGAVFVGGAIGVEMVSGVEANANSESTLAYVLIITVEETMEMLGIVIFIHALADYLCQHIGRIQIQFGRPDRLQGISQLPMTHEERELLKSSDALLAEVQSY